MSQHVVIFCISLVHCFIINLDDNSVLLFFTNEEIDQLRGHNYKGEPELCTDIRETLTSLNKVSDSHS